LVPVCKKKIDNNDEVGRTSTAQQQQQEQEQQQ